MSTVNPQSCDDEALSSQQTSDDPFQSQPLLQEHDAAFYQQELASFIPDKVFDAHTHVWIEEASRFRIPNFQGDVGLEQYIQLMEDLHPERRLGALFIGYGAPEDPRGRNRSNQWVSDQIAGHSHFRGELFVSPTDDPDWVRQEIVRLKLHGLKCYHTFSAHQPTWESDIPDYLPERLVKVADDLGLVITLHMVKSRACADPQNAHWIRQYCEKYPNMKLILAHSARGFQPSHNLEGLSRLKGLNNLYFDTSANCEPIAHQAIIRIMGHRKLLYGSDLPVSHMRGRSLAAANSFLWLYENSPIWGEKHLRIKPVLIGLEHLRSIKWACWSERLNDSQIEDIFWNNAAELFRLA